VENLENAEIAIIGLGGMGSRHIKAAELLGAKIVSLCDVNPENLQRAAETFPDAQQFASVEKFIAAGAHLADLVCLVTNTPFRADILRQLADAKAKRVLTEKPFTTNVRDAHEISELYAAADIPLTVNTFRHFCANHLKVRDLIRTEQFGEPRNITVHSASTGLGNMGSVFLDLMNFFIQSPPVMVTGSIDQTGTPSPRGPQYRDPAGFGMVLYENGCRGFLDTGEDTGIPYTFHVATTYGRVFIDELFHNWRAEARTRADRKDKPLTYYLTELEDVPLETSHGYDPVEMTSFTMRAALGDLPEARNAAAAATVMEMIMAMHVSHQQGSVPIPLPLAKEFYDLDLPFA
jgi:predicted dehydrogenase